DDLVTSSEEGDLTGKDVLISPEVGTKYQDAFNAPAFMRFSLSADQSLNLSANSPYYQLQLWQDTNGNLQQDDGEQIQATSPGYWSDLKPGQNYYIEVVEEQ